MARTSLGVDPGLVNTDFVFGDEAEVVRVRFHLADNLHHAESIAQQNLDFIRKLYLEQSNPGEYFEQIHLATEIDLGIEPKLESEQNAEAAFENETDTARHANKSPTLRREAMDLLFEHLQQWIQADAIPLKLLCHDDIAIASQKRRLNLHKPLIEFSIHDKANESDALALWSFAFASKSEPIKPSLSKGPSVDYETLNEHFIDQYLPGYKRELVKKFTEMTYPNADIEDERRILLNLANDQDSTKFELLYYQERITGMLKKHMRSIATTSENPQREFFVQTATIELLPDDAIDAQADLTAAAPDVGLFDIEAIDNAEKIWSEINQTIERNRTREAQQTTDTKTNDTVEEVLGIKPTDEQLATSSSTTESSSQLPMFELEAQAVPTGFIKHKSRKSRSASRSRRDQSLSDDFELTTKQTDTQAVSQPGNLPNASIRSKNVAVEPAASNDQPMTESDTAKHNDFFSSPNFAVTHSGKERSHEKPTRNEAWYLPVIAVVAVAGIYYFIK